MNVVSAGPTSWHASAMDEPSDRPPATSFFGEIMEERSSLLRRAGWPPPSRPLGVAAIDARKIKKTLVPRTY